MGGHCPKREDSVKAQAPREVELKLELSPADVPRMRDLLTARFGAGAPAVRLSSVYYDTPAQDLAAERVTLRVRRQDGGAPVQTVKRSHATQAGLFERDEWETELTEAEPDFDAFAQTSASRSVSVEPRDLAPVFETVVERIVWQVATHDYHIEVALDDGRVVAGQRSEPLAEVEFELKRGSPRDLFRTLDAFAEIRSLRPGVLAKSERGFRLARAKPPRASKAEPLHLSKSMTTAEAFQRIGHACLRHYGLNVPLVVSRRAPDALHQTRVALRRLRSAFSLFKGAVADRDSASLKAELRNLAALLGEARNLDVYLSGSVREEAERAEGEPGLALFLAEMERRRAVAYDKVVERLESPEVNRLMLRLVTWLEAGPWLMERDPRRVAARERPLRRTAARILDKKRRRVKRQGRDLATIDPHARHRVRIEAKKLRYAAEFFAGLARGPKRSKRHAGFVAALEDLQDSLGALNDIQTGHDIALSFAPTDGGPLPAAAFPASHVDGRQDAAVEPLLQAAQTAQGRLVAAKRFWSGWRAG